ncbi:MAG: diacylglycerol/lipid kinase family protein [Chthoniobacterales bacterium]
MIVILNRAAGADSRPNAQESEIRDLFANAGGEISIQHPDQSRDVTALAQAAAVSEDEIVVAGGGDGTISAVAGALVGTGKTLGVLPLGTLNHFAKDLGIPLELPEAIATIAHGASAEVDVGEVNGRVFINNSSLGLYPRIVARREAQQDELGRRKWPAAIWATAQAFRRFPFLDLRITLDGKQLVRQTPFLFVGNNEYEFTGLNLGGRACLNHGQLGLYLARRTGRLGLFRLALGALCGRLKRAGNFDSHCVCEATVELPQARVLVAIDGEITWMKTPLHYRIRSRALRVLVPPS